MVKRRSARAGFCIHEDKFDFFICQIVAIPKLFTTRKPVGSNTLLVYFIGRDFRKIEGPLIV